MKRATIIGAGGFIGRALLQHLQGAGWTCHVPPRQAPMMLPAWGKDRGHLFYCAGLTADYIQRPVDTIEAHVCLLTRLLAEACHQSLVYLSSTRVYDGLESGADTGEERAFSLAPGNPRHLYDLSKLTGESICRVMGQGRARVARLSCVYGDHRDPDGFLPQVLRQVAATPRGAALALDSSPWFERDYVHVGDVVTALVAIAEAGQQPVYNLAQGSNLSNERLGQMVAERAGRQIHFKTEHRPPPPAVINIRRLQDEFGWTPASVEARLGPWLSVLD